MPGHARSRPGGAESAATATATSSMTRFMTISVTSSPMSTGSVATSASFQASCSAGGRRSALGWTRTSCSITAGPGQRGGAWRHWWSPQRSSPHRAPGSRRASLHARRRRSPTRQSGRPAGVTPPRIGESRRSLFPLKSYEFVRRVIADWSPEDVHEGDMFFTNDPWWGALHANDGILASPIFWEGRLIAWSTIVMHDNDVGSSVPGSWVTGAARALRRGPAAPRGEDRGALRGPPGHRAPLPAQQPHRRAERVEHAGSRRGAEGHAPAGPRAHRPVRPRRVPRRRGGDPRQRRAGAAAQALGDPRRRVVRQGLPRPRRHRERHLRDLLPASPSAATGSSSTWPAHHRRHRDRSTARGRRCTPPCSAWCSASSATTCPGRSAACAA